jgi:N-methylhydantoinase A
MHEEGPRVGVDVGGTFTDVVTVADGAIRVAKTPSTPDAPEAGVVTGLEAASEAGRALDAVAFLGHGTTVATNAVLEGTWADAGLVTTEGFRDALEIGRQERPDLYDLRAEKPDPVIPRDRRHGVPERLDERGAVVRDLAEDAVRAVAEDLAAQGVDAVAVTLLFAFENDAHERRVADVLDDRLDVPVSRSSDVLPEIREYERTLATALNAALVPVMADYLGTLDGALDDLGIPAPLRVMQSSGGTMVADAARDRPVRTLLSGPAAGVQGAAYVAERAGHDDVLSMDMGGTSCDVSLVTGGEPTVTTETTVGDYPVAVPAVDVHTVGAGGGSIAWLDAGGALRVGPRSAGANPGPICYGRGGTEPTTTDAHLALGRLDPDALLSGDLAADVDAVRAGIREHVADPLGGSVEEAARGILRVADANMERALRVVSVERGHDPRAFALVAFGGAGPLHAAALADALDVPRVVVPRTAGVLSALGLLVSDVVYDYGRTKVRRLDEVAPDDLADTFDTLAEKGQERLADEGFPGERRAVERSVDLRYVGQSFDLSVPVPDALDAGDDSAAADSETEVLDALVDRFHERHRERYGHADPDEPVELVAVRLRASGLVEPPDLAPPVEGGSADDAVRETREVGFAGGVHETRIYDRARLPAGASFDGPAVVEGDESTVLVHPGQAATVDDDGNVVLEVDP